MEKLEEKIHTKVERRIEKHVETLHRGREGLEIHHIEVNENYTSKIK